MKIVLNDVNDVEDFLRMLSPAYFRLVHKASEGMDKLADNIGSTEDPWAPTSPEQILEDVAAYLGVDGLPTDITQPGPAATNEPGPSAADAELPERDEDGVAHNTDWHSEPAKINADGRWRARRKRDEDAYKAWLAGQDVEVAEAAIAADEAEPIATETHALPQDEQSEGAFRAAASRETASDETHAATEKMIAELRAALAVDLEALIAASQEAAQDASDSHVDLLNACRDFTSKHGHPAFTALKAAVAPDDAGSGKAVQHFTPGERRLMQACIANYPTHKEA